MLYVLTLGWVWFAAAGALGLLVGFATATRGRGGEFSGWWVILAAFGVLAGGFAGAELGLVPGRAGLQLEIGLLATLAYFIGLPIGGGAKSLLPAPAAAPMKPTPVVVRGRPRDEESPAANSSPAPKSAAAPKSAPAPKSPTLDEPAPAKSETAKSETFKSETAAAAHESAAKASPAKKHFPGHASRKPRGAARRHARRSDQDQGHWTQKRREAACARRISLRSDRRLEHRQCALDRRGAVRSRPGRARKMDSAGARACRRQGAVAMKRLSRRGAAALALAVALFAPLFAPALAQDMLRGVDLTLPAYSRSDYSREEIVALLKAQTPDAPLDLSGKSLNGADLSGLDFSHVNLRAARLVKTRLSGAKLDGAILDQAWMLEADLTGASLVGAHLFSAQLQRARADGADFSRARIAGDLTGASLRGAKFREANMAADMKNQSMGLMRAVLASAIAEGADFTAADLMSADLRYLHAAGADFSGASMQGADAAGADFTGAKWDGAKVSGLDLDSARIDDDAAALLKDAKGLRPARAK